MPPAGQLANRTIIGEFAVKTIQIVSFAAGAVVLTAASLATGYWMHSDEPAALANAAPVTSEQPPPTGKPLYYQNPDGKPDYSPTPKKTADGRAYKPV